MKVSAFIQSHITEGAQDMLKSEYLQHVYTQVVTRDPDQREFHQAVLEVLAVSYTHLTLPTKA